VSTTLSPSIASPVMQTPDPVAATRNLVRLTLAAFLCYLTIGIPLPVLPLYVHHQLGFGNVIVGVAIGSQFLATVLTRRFAGSISDHKGGRTAMLRGFVMSAIAGAAYILAVALPFGTNSKLLILLMGRLLLGIGESLLITGCLTWGIGLVGQARAGRVMAWTGMALYGALAVGSPIGLGLNGLHGFTAVALGVTLLPLAAYGVASGVPHVAARPAASHRTPFRRMLRTVLRPGSALFMQGVGFAAIGTFISLYFDSMHWNGAGLALSAFGGCFVLIRIVAGHLPDKVGGYPIAIASFVVEIIGQVLLWRAGSGSAALLGAGITGLGCSLMFPALGVEVVKYVSAENRGTALGAYAAFQDVSYGVTGPLAGLVASGLGFREVFLCGTMAAACGLFLTSPIRQLFTGGKDSR